MFFRDIQQQLAGLHSCCPPLHCCIGVNRYQSLHMIAVKYTAEGHAVPIEIQGRAPRRRSGSALMRENVKRQERYLMMMVARCWGLGFDWKNDAQERHPTTTVRRHQKPGSDWRGGVAWLPRCGPVAVARGGPGADPQPGDGPAGGVRGGRPLAVQDGGRQGQRQADAESVLRDRQGRQAFQFKDRPNRTAFCIKAGQRQVWVSNSVENK